MKPRAVFRLKQANWKPPTENLETQGHGRRRCIPLEARLIRLFRELGIERAHVAARIDADWQVSPPPNGDRLASLSLPCPTALDPLAATPMAPRLLVIAEIAAQRRNATRTQASSR